MLNLDIQAYVTQESQPSLEEGEISKDKKTGCSSLPAMSNGGRMSSLVGTGNNFWAGAYYAASLVGFVVSFGLLQKFYTIPFGVTSWWYKGLLFFTCMVASVIVFGGLIIFLWGHFEREREKSSREEGAESEKDCDFGENIRPEVAGEPAASDIMSLMTTHYGRRPDFQELFDSFSRAVGHVDVGVLVCGPSGLQTNVARECRRQIIRGKWDQPIFHFHSHSFDL